MIHLVVGPPCAGKSTFVETNAPPGVPRFDFDRVAETVGALETQHNIPSEVALPVLAMRNGLFGWLLDGEVEPPEMWVVSANPTASTVDRFKARGATVHLLDPGEAECIARAQREGRPDSTVDQIKAWYASPPQIDDEKGGAMERKFMQSGIQFKAADDDVGEIEAYAAVFDNVDSYGDVLRKGAFEETLAERAAAGRVIPLLYGHDFSDPFSNIGYVTDAKEDERGLLVKARFDLDNPKAAQVYRLVKEKRLSEMSFAFQTLDGGFAEQDGEDIYELRKVKLFEVSVVPIGANPETEILAVKRGLEELTRRFEERPEAKHQSTPTPGDAPGVSSCGRANALMAEILILQGVK